MDAEIKVNTFPPQYVSYMVNFMLHFILQGQKNPHAASGFASKILWDLSTLNSAVKV
jgi:hypothetical protein